MDLSFQDGMINSDTIYSRREMNDFIKFRGKTLVDCLAKELTKKPLSIAFLENVDKADLLAQNSLSQAIRTSKLSDSHGREISINNTKSQSTYASDTMRKYISNPIFFNKWKLVSGTDSLGQPKIS